MRKILVIAVLVLSLVSCVEKAQPQMGDSIVLSKEEYESLKRATTPEYPRVLGEFNTNNNSDWTTTISVIAIDSCEYIGNIETSNNDVLAHKGNCKFCHERREVQHQRLVDEILYRLTHKTKDSVQ